MGEFSLVRRTSSGLIFATAFSSLFGFVFWFVAARLYPPDSVGVVTAAASTMSLAVVATTAGLSAFLLRTLPANPLQASRLVRVALVYAVLSSSFLAAVMAVVVAIFSLVSSSLPSSSWFVAAATVLGAGLAGAAVVMDAVATFARASLVVVHRAALTSVGKTVFLFLPFPLLGLSAGVAVALTGWVAAALVALAWAWWRLRATVRSHPHVCRNPSAPALTAPPPTSHATVPSVSPVGPPTSRAYMLTAFYTHIAAVGFALPVLGLPLAAALLQGPVFAAILYVPWLVGAALGTASSLIANVTLAEASRSPEQTALLLRAALRLCLMVVAPAAALAALTSFWGLSLLGPEYATAWPLLVCAAAAAVLACVPALAFALWRVQGRYRGPSWAALCFGVASLLVLLAVLHLGFVAVGVCWLAVNAVAAAACTPSVYRAARFGVTSPTG